MKTSILLLSALVLSTAISVPATAAPKRPAVCTELDRVFEGPGGIQTGLLLISSEPDYNLYDTNVRLPGSQSCLLTRHYDGKTTAQCQTAPTNRASASQWVRIFSQTLTLCYHGGDVVTDWETWEDTKDEVFTIQLTSEWPYSALTVSTEDVLDDGQVRVAYKFNIAPPSL